MATAVAKGSEVQIFREDQVKINTFAKKNHKLQVMMGWDIHHSDFVWKPSVLRIIIFTPRFFTCRS